MSDLSQDIFDDLSAFSDDPEEVAFDTSGSFVMSRHGELIQGRVIQQDSSLFVEENDQRVTYGDFLKRRLAQLDVLAKRIIERRDAPHHFVDGGARWERIGDSREGQAAELLRSAYTEQSPFASKVIFITADAGLGKTQLLSHLQREVAEDFVAGRSNSLFWHVDLQGRRLLLLHEALAGDLASLRFSGLWEPSILRLLRHRFLTLAIDGFDELAAEQGGTEAVGSLAQLVQSLGGQGTVVAASRRTFFDTEDYQGRSGLLARHIQAPCEFDEIRLLPWNREQTSALFLEVASELGNASAGPDAVRQLEHSLGGDASHPMLTRPFLVSHIATAILSFGLSPDVFGGVESDTLAGVARVVEAFIRREVSDKWLDRDTKVPYLSEGQHMSILADVAEEMYRLQVERLPLELIEELVALRLEEWAIDPIRSQQIMAMVKMHVLLVRPSIGSDRERSFDHPEFRDYFTALSLRKAIEETVAGEPRRLVDQLRMAQLSDSAARYVFSVMSLDEGERRSLVDHLVACLKEEWKPSYLQQNIGSMVAYALDSISFDPAIEVDTGVVFASVVLEESRLQGVVMRDVTFVNVSLRGVNWVDVELSNSDLGEVVVGADSMFDRVVLDRCQISCLRVLDVNQEETTRAFSPDQIARVLKTIGIEVAEPEAVQGALDLAREETDLERLARRMTLLFLRTTTVNEDVVRLRFRQDHARILSEVLPAMEAAGIVRREQWAGSGSQSIWQVRRSAEEVLRAREGLSDDASLLEFWEVLRA